MRSHREWFDGCCADIESAQEHLRWAEHIFITYPFWLGGMPALLKGFFEQVMRPGFALTDAEYSPLLGGRSARIVVTMGMPRVHLSLAVPRPQAEGARAESPRLAGIKPVRSTVIGRTESLSVPGRGKWLDDMHRLGRAAA